MTVYILAYDDSPFSVNRVTAAVGFARLGEEVELFTRAAPPFQRLQAGDIVVGGIGLAHDAFVALGIPLPSLPIMPKALAPFAGRAMWEAPMAELRRDVAAGRVVFAKPRPERYKLFDGTLFTGFRDLIGTAHIADDELVCLAEPVDFLSEFRCFILRGDIVGLRHYKGDPLCFPDPEVLRAAVAAYAPEAPAGYALDIGVTDLGQSLVVEINDGYAVGAYGLPPVRYANLIAARWQELAQASALGAGSDVPAGTGGSA